MNPESGGFNPDANEVAQARNVESKDLGFEAEKSAFMAAMAVLRAENPDVTTMSLEELKQLEDRTNPTLVPLYERLEVVSDELSESLERPVWFQYQLASAYKEAGLLSLFEAALDDARQVFFGSPPEVREKWRARFESLDS